MAAKIDNLDGIVFRGKINLRLSLFFAFLFLLLLLLGTMSHYLAQTMLLNTDRMRKESEREVQVDRIDDTFHHFVSSLEEAALQGTAISDAERLAYVQSLQSLLTRYYELSGLEEGASGDISEVIAGLASLSEKLTNQSKLAPTSISKRLTAQDLAALNVAQQKMQAFNARRAEIHRGRLEEEFREAQQRMRLISGIYTAFAFSGGLFIVASSIFFFHAIAKPLRRLVHQACEIADGNLDNRVPVTSTDEIGQLSYIFNFMVGRLREHETRLRVLATIEERELLAQELHDSLAQDLAILRLNLSAAEKDFPFDKDALIKDVLSETRKSVDRTYKDVRQAILGLHAGFSKSLDFVPTLTEYLHNFSEMSKIPVDLDIDSPETMRFSAEAEVQLIRIIHEALTNIFKHAHATRGAVKFERDREFVKMAIEDNGTGLVIDEGARTGLRFGLQSMRKRAKGIGGKLLIESVVGKGTRVIVHLPFEEGRYGANSNAPSR